jgi:hypothetical protein
MNNLERYIQYISKQSIEEQKEFLKDMYIKQMKLYLHHVLV